MYKGKEDCQGCKKPATEAPRRNKTDLCFICEKRLNIGTQLEPTVIPGNYSRVFATWYQLQFYNSKHHGEEIDKGFRDLLKALNLKNLEYQGLINLTPHGTGTTASDTYIIRTEQANAIKAICDAMEKQQWDLREQMEQLEILKEEVVTNERTKIYNEGIEYGRNLLLQLNEGKITLDHFSKEANYEK